LSALLVTLPVPADMMSMLPVYFLSHGAPDLLLRQTPASDFLRSLTLPPARVILAVSAHWETDDVRITASPKPETIHDFYGFPQALYAMHYDVAGDPAIAQEVIEVLQAHGMSAVADTQRGLDHGAWMPLMMAAPQADVPVLQLSIQRGQGAQHHYALGQALKALRDQGVLIVTSGNATHNVHAALRGNYQDVPEHVRRFNDRLNHLLIGREDALLMQEIEQGAEAQWNHPTDDHIMPLFVALGATQGEAAQRIHESYDYQVLSMDSYRFGS
jgi:4,5-DOPA dioxygenase extradiol